MCGSHPSHALDCMTLNEGGLLLHFVAVTVCEST